MEFLCEFDFEVKHIKGKEYKVVDSLSRKFHVATMSTCQEELRDKILKVVASDEFALNVKIGLLVNPMARMHEGYQVEEDGLLLYKDRMYIPINPKLNK